MTFSSERAIKSTRKRHLCSACDKWIEIGEPAINWTGNTGGDFGSVHYHPDCRQAEIEYNYQCVGGWDDEWSRLCDAEHEDLPWIKEKWPVPYLRMCMTREQWALRALATPINTDEEGE